MGNETHSLKTLRTYSLKRDINKYYSRNENGSLILLEEYILSYSFFAGPWRDPNICPRVHLFVKHDLTFELFFVWHEYPNPNLIESYLEGRLPDNIKDLLQEIMEYPSLELKDSYTDSGDVYAVEDISRESITFNHNGANQGIDLSPYYFRDYLMVTDQELTILKLYKELDQWLKKSFESVKKDTHNSKLTQPPNALYLLGGCAYLQNVMGKFNKDNG